MILQSSGLMLQSIFTTPIVLAATTTPSNVIFQPLHSAFMPYVWECAKVLLYAGLIQGVYYIMRADTKQATNKIKYASTGYILIRFIDVFVRLVDTVANNMNFK